MKKITDHIRNLHVPYYTEIISNNAKEIYFFKYLGRKNAVNRIANKEIITSTWFFFSNLQEETTIFKGWSEGFLWISILKCNIYCNKAEILKSIKPECVNISRK